MGENGTFDNNDFRRIDAPVPLFEEPLAEGAGMSVSCVVILETVLHDFCILNRESHP